MVSGKNDELAFGELSTNRRIGSSLSLRMTVITYGELQTISACHSERIRD